MPPKSIRTRPKTRKSWKRHVVPDAPDSPEIHHIYNRNAKRHRWILASDPNPSVAPPAAFNEDGSDNDGFEFDYGGSPGAGSSLDKKAADDARWLALLDKLVLAYKISCASKMPEPAMDQAPSFGCGCDHLTATGCGFV
ncbi:hypothetical protein [Absidia glauca]|uniref:Uncharacterized protein n=1 Tax=Absidia glauca TaxID=4829 RepID=A0A163JKZ0_ABSGL|nr:hypothetical protein [Absidia glauca]